LPRACGIYYFYNEADKPIYISRSNNIRNKVLSILSACEGKKNLKLKAEATNITAEVTGSELIALLLEHVEIKTLKPLYNSQNFKISKLQSEKLFADENYLIIDKGRTEEERSAVILLNNKHFGFGFFDPECITTPHEIIDQLKLKPLSNNVKGLIHNYLIKNKVEKIIKL
jgi:DNA polymerase-3 subunit epsilon